MHLFCEVHLLHHFEHHICYFKRFPISQFNDKSGRVDLIYIFSKSWNSLIIINMVFLLPSFIEVVMLCALLNQVRKEGGQRRYEMREITNVVIMFTSDSKRRKFKKL